MKTLLFFLAVLILALTSCQKEIAPVDPQQRQQTTLSIDTVTSIVVDGTYGVSGGSSDFDSAVFQLSGNGIVIMHFDRSGLHKGDEAISYDNQGRISAYHLNLGSIYDYRTFQYSTDSLVPTNLYDSTTDGIDYVLRYRSTGSTQVSGVKQFIYYGSFVALGGTVSSKDTLTAVFDNRSLLKSVDRPANAQTRYYYNAAGDADSCRSIDLVYADNSNYTALYTSTDNPLAKLATALYRNLHPYAVAAQLNDFTGYDDVLNVSYLPSELLASKIPALVRWGDGQTFTDEMRYQFTVQNNRVTAIDVSHKDLSTGATDNTKLRFYYK